MSRRSQVIHQPAELAALCRFSLHRSRRRQGPWRLHASFTHPRRVRWEWELNERYFACGCDVGARALWVAALPLGYCAGIALAAGWVGVPTALGLVLGGSLLAAVAGKLQGLRQAQRRLRQLVREIQGAWPTAAERRLHAASFAVKEPVTATVA